MFDHRFAQLIFGRLSWESFPFHEPILLVTFIVVALAGAGLVGAVTWFRLWGWLWRDWFTSVDHKKIGIMYMILGVVMLLRGFADALMMRIQQAIAFGPNQGYLPAHHYDQVFTAHGTIMIFFRRHSAGRRSHQLCHAAPDRRARRGVPVPQQPQLLVDRWRARCW